MYVIEKFILSTQCFSKDDFVSTTEKIKINCGKGDMFLDFISNIYLLLSMLLLNHQNTNIYIAVAKRGKPHYWGKFIAKIQSDLSLWNETSSLGYLKIKSIILSLLPTFLSFWLKSITIHSVQVTVSLNLCKYRSNKTFHCSFPRFVLLKGMR